MKQKNGRKIQEMMISKEVMSVSRVRKINYNVIDRKEGESIEKLKVHSLHRLNLVEEGP